MIDYTKIMKRKGIGRNLSIIFRATKSKFQECHKKNKIALTMAQIPILSFLVDEDSDKSVSQDFITKSLGIDKATTTRVVKNLIKDGFIIRKKDKRDKRAYNLSLTKSGKELKFQIMKMMIEWSDIIYNGITSEEIDILEKITNKITDNIRKYKEEKRYENI